MRSVILQEKDLSLTINFSIYIIKIPPLLRGYFETRQSLLKDKWCNCFEYPRDKSESYQSKECCHELFLGFWFDLAFIKTRNSDTNTEYNHKKYPKNKTNKKNVFINTCDKIYESTLRRNTTSIPCHLSASSYTWLFCTDTTRFTRDGTNFCWCSEIFSGCIIVGILCDCAETGGSRK